MRIRKGDSLLLAAYNGNGEEGFEIEIEGEDEPYLATGQNPFAYRFEREGRFLVEICWGQKSVGVR